MIIEKRSLLTGKTHQMDLPITEEQLAEFVKGGRLVQDIFPELTASQREFLLTGSTDEEWNDVFGDEDGEE